MTVKTPRVPAVTLWIAILALGCSSGGESSGDSSQSMDVVPADAAAMDVSTSLDASLDAPALDESGFTDQGQAPVPTELLKGPWLQWPTSDAFIVMAESKDEVPLEFVVRVGEEVRATVWSEPFKPKAVSDVLPAPSFDGWLHEAVVTGVQPGESFVVEVVNSGDTASGRIPAAGAQVKMVVFGDNRTQEEPHAMVVDAIVPRAPEVVLNSGDMVDVGGDGGDWSTFYRIEAPLLASAFYYPVFGNHESFLGQGYFAGLFHTENGFMNEGNWYTVIGDVGLLALNQYGPSDWSDPDALAWLEAGLSELRSKAAWVFVAFHEPLYTFSNHGPWKDGRGTVLPLMREYGVDMVFSGHNHCYEHFLVDGIHFVVTGGGGAPLYGLDEGPPEEQDLLVQAKKFYHFVELSITADEVDVNVIDATTGETFESWSLTK